MTCKKDKETATPCVVSRMIEKLPAESDPQYTEAYTVAQDTSAVAYVGKLKSLNLLPKSAVLNHGLTSWL